MLNGSVIVIVIIILMSVINTCNYSRIGLATETMTSSVSPEAMMMMLRITMEL